MAADALVVVGGDIAPGGRFGLLDAIHRGLRAIHHAIVALETHAAAHAALGLGNDLLFIQYAQAFLEITQRSFPVEGDHLALVARHIGKMPEKQLVMRDHVAVGAVIEVVQRDVGVVGAAHRLVRLLDLDALLGQLAHQVEMMRVDLGTLFQVAAQQKVVKAVGSDGTVADCSRQQVRADHVAGGEHALLSRDHVVAVGADRSLAIVEFFQPGEIHRLADRRNNQVGLDILLAACDGLDLQFAARHFGFTLRHAQRRSTAIRAAHDADRRQAAANVDAFGQRLRDLVLVGLHLVDVEHRSQRHVRALFG